MPSSFPLFPLFHLPLLPLLAFRFLLNPPLIFDVIALYEPSPSPLLPVRLRSPLAPNLPHSAFQFILEYKLLSSPFPLPSTLASKKID